MTDKSDLDEFLEGLNEAIKTGAKVINIINDVADVKDTLEAMDTLDNLEIKPFGNLGAHIVVPYKYIGKKVKVIVKKNGR